ncbi:MAG: hypothetical protein D6785_15415, partial [Planctomycetota bacterium]
NLSLLLKVSLDNSHIQLIKDPKYRRKFGLLGFELQEEDLETYYRWLKKNHPHLAKGLDSSGLLVMAWMPPKIEALFNWKMWKTIEKAGLKPKDVKLLKGRFRKIGKIWILEIYALKLKDGRILGNRDFELALLQP